LKNSIIITIITYIIYYLY